MGIQISECTIQQYVNKGQAGESPNKKGQTGTHSKDVFETLAGAFESHICINQLNENSGENVCKKLNKVVGRD